MNRYQFEDLISAYIENELSLSKRKEVENYIKVKPDSQQLVERLKINLQALKSSPKISAKEDFNKRLLTRINSHGYSVTTSVNRVKTIFGFSLFNATLMVSLLAFFMLLSLEITSSGSVMKNYNGNKFTEYENPPNQSIIKKHSVEENLSNPNFTSSNNDTIKNKKVDYSKNIKFVND